ncbi:processed acidic surface protein [Mesobacillus maritimus]|uniref:Processed acidic surface protein n=1 Tax=Mesobacillus maritimus TaxID=1643336 RepID=A0ABS7K4E4_9BACI|nr:processed acidic surface protein [Mesobacillus maritimus]MBY0097121.1 processed acidic surface protein [Mesobacillus maritimus]
MWRIGRFVLCMVLIMSLVPSVGFAFSDQELANFLKTEKITEEQLNEHLLRFYESSVEELESIEEIEYMLGDKITSENLAELLNYYELDSEEDLVALLVESGEMQATDNIRDIFIYIDALDMTVDSNTGTLIAPENLQELLDENGLTIEDLKTIFTDNEDSIDNYKFIEDLEDMLYVYGRPLNDQTLQLLLSDYGLTLEQLNAILAENDDSLENYDSIDDLEYALLDYGTPITGSNLQELLETYELTREQLDQLLAQYDDAIENYETIDELYFNLIFYMILEEDSGELLNDLGIGLNKEELVNLVKHFLTIDFMDPNFMEQITEIEARLAAFGEFESANDLTPEQMTGMINLYHEMMNLFGFEAKYYLVKGDDKIALTEQEALTLENTNGYDLMIELYNLQGEFLADIILTADLFGSELIDKIGEKLDVVKTVPKEAAVSTEVVRTVNGGKLPNTAGNYVEGLLAGLALILIGGLLFRKRTVKQS